MPSEYRKLDHPLILKIVVTVHQLILSGKRVLFVWLPSHTGMAGNVSPDAAAKAALDLAESQTPVPFSIFYSHKYCFTLATVLQRLNQ